MIRRALQRQIQRHLHAQVLDRGDELVEVGDRAQLRMHRVVAALVAADRPRRSDVAGRRRRGVVAALAVNLADRVDRRQVHDVEAHLRDPRQRRGRGGEGAVHRIAVGVPAAGRARKHLVPGPEAGQRPVHPHPVLLAAGDQLAQRKLASGVRRSRRSAPARRATPDRREPAAPPRPPATARAGRAEPRSRRAPAAAPRPAGRWTVRSRPGRRPAWPRRRAARCESGRPSRPPGTSTARRRPE